MSNKNKLPKQKSNFYFLKFLPNNKYETHRVDPIKHDMLNSYIANNLNMILKDRNKWAKKNWRNKFFPRYTAKKEAFEKMMKQCGCTGEKLVVSYEVPSNLLFEITIRSTKRIDKIIRWIRIKLKMRVR